MVGCQGAFSDTTADRVREQWFVTIALSPHGQSIIAARTTAPSHSSCLYTHDLTVMINKLNCFYPDRLVIVLFFCCVFECASEQRWWADGLQPFIPSIPSTPLLTKHSQRVWTSRQTMSTVKTKNNENLFSDPLLLNKSQSWQSISTSTVQIWAWCPLLLIA